MAVQRISVSCIEIKDEPGGLQGLLALLAETNVDLLCFTAFSTGTGSGEVFLSAKNQQALAEALSRADIKAEAAIGFIVDCEDKVGAAAEALKGLADAGINGRAGAAMVCDGRAWMLIVVNTADADDAERALS